MKITRIYIKGNNRREIIKSATIKKDIGIVGNGGPKRAHRQVSIFSEQARREIENLENHGLCTKRFHEDITIEDLTIQDISIGDKFTIGKAILEVTECGKECYNNCQLIQGEKPCPLAKGAIYARVEAEGCIKIGDFVIKN